MFEASVLGNRSVETDAGASGPSRSRLPGWSFQLSPRPKLRMSATVPAAAIRSRDSSPERWAAVWDGFVVAFELERAGGAVTLAVEGICWKITWRSGPT